MKCPPPDSFPVAVLCASILSLALAYAAQYGFGLAPCHLCLWQRVPYAIVIVLALMAMRFPRHKTLLAGAIGIAFLAGGATAAYHSAVEKHWVAGPTGCTAAASSPNQSLDDFLNRINHAPIVACDQPAWEWHGVTMANLNALWSLLLAGAAFVAVQQYRREKRHA